MCATHIESFCDFPSKTLNDLNMISSSFGLNNSNTPPKRTSQPRDEKTHPNNFYFEDEQYYIGSDSWIEVDNCWIFLPSTENILQSRSIFKIKVRNCLYLINDFINCAIDGIQPIVHSPLELLMGISSILSSVHFPSVLISLFTSDIVKSLIRNKQHMTTDVAKEKAQLRIHSLFKILINEIEEILAYIKIEISINGLEQLNPSQKKLEQSISKTIFYIFEDKNVQHQENEIMNSEISCLTNLILSSLTNAGNLIAKVGVFSLLSESIESLQKSIRIFTSQICWCLIRDKMPIPFSGKEFFNFIRLNTEINIDNLNKLENLNYWNECAFLSIARIFLKEKLPPGPIENTVLISYLSNYFKLMFDPEISTYDRKNLLQKVIFNSLISSEKEHTEHPSIECLAPILNIKSVLKISCDKISMSFLCLTRLLNIIIKRLPITIFASSNIDAYTKIINSLLFTFNDFETKEILSAAISEYEQSEILESTSEKIQSKILSTDTCDVSIPKRRSKARSSRQIKSSIDDSARPYSKKE